MHDAGRKHLNWVRISWEGRHSTADPLLLCQHSWRMETDSFGLDQILLRCATVAVPPWLLPSPHKVRERYCKCPQVSLRGITMFVFLPN